MRRWRGRDSSGVEVDVGNGVWNSMQRAFDGIVKNGSSRWLIVLLFRQLELRSAKTNGSLSEL